MAGVKNSDIPDVFAYMGEIWAFLKSAWIPEDNDEYWKYVENEARKLLDSYDHDFCVAHTCFCLEYFKWRRIKDKGETDRDFNTWLYTERVELGESKKNQEEGMRRIHESG